jgi:membrane protease subunit HflK
LLLGVSLLSSTFFTIDPEEEGVVLQFGEFKRTVDPGLHFKLPSSFETFEKVPT